MNAIPCISSAKHVIEISMIQESIKWPIRTNCSFQVIFDTKLTKMEGRLITMIDEKLISIDNRMETINMCTESTLQQPSLNSNVSTSATPKRPTYASKVLMLDAENEKKVEENE